MATIRVDREACCGNGMCFAIAPEVFDLGDDGAVVLIDPKLTPQNEAAVGQAIANCPTGAIEVEGESS
ncbi:ferredoxin [Streptomyces sp. NBC_01352]|uniref:ferredoxin n=1 Tax=Streptomyces sp. NBC_01352 TaxID=2903834 RepID=UPI002E2F8C35|nr:ferredoxin [Streptomyces sp. NBC_01352]